MDFEKIKTCAVDGTFKTIATLLRGDLVDFWSKHFKIDKNKYEKSEELAKETIDLMKKESEELRKELFEDNNSKYTDGTILVQTCNYPTVATSMSFDGDFSNHLSSLSLNDFEKLKEAVKNNGGEIVEEYGSYGFKYIKKLDAPDVKELAFKLRKMKTLNNDVERIQDGVEKEEETPKKKDETDLLKEAIERLKSK